jgi:hypothetical protein
VVLPLFFEWSSLPRGISPLLTKSFNSNVILHMSCGSFTWVFNCNSITSHLLVAIHGLSTTIKLRQFGRFVHHHQCRAFISPTWTHLQIVSNAPTAFHEHDISMLYDFRCLEIHQPIRLRTFSISDKHAFDFFRIEFAPLLVWNHHICNTSKHIHVCNARLPPASRFFGCNKAQGTCQTSV